MPQDATVAQEESRLKSAGLRVTHEEMCDIAFMAGWDDRPKSEVVREWPIHEIVMRARDRRERYRRAAAAEAAV